MINRIDLISNGAGTVTGSEFEFLGGKCNFMIEGTFQTGGSGKLQFLSPNATWIDYPNGSFTANGQLDVVLPRCRVRALMLQTLAATKTITAITKANPAVVTSTAHGYSNGDRVYIAAVVGMTQVNGLEFIVAGVTANTFQLSGIDSTNYTTYVSGGTAQKVSRLSAAYLYLIGRPQ